MTADDLERKRESLFGRFEERVQSNRTVVGHLEDLFLGMDSVASAAIHELRHREHRPISVPSSVDLTADVIPLRPHSKEAPAPRTRPGA
jgi:hypothetical protein